MVSNNKIGAEGGKAIGEALKVNTSLISIGLDDTKIGDEGAKAIGEALKGILLTRIYSRNNNIGAEGKAFGEALKVNTSLTKIYLRDNNIGDKARQSERH